MIFHIFVGKEQVGGGGRYDALIPSMGGGNVPASGFALYLDRLMKMLKTVTALIPPIKRVLIKGGDAKEIFKTADALRQAGYIAELDLDGQKAEWTLEVKSDGALTLINKAKKKTDAKSVGEVIKLLGAQNAS